MEMSKLEGVREVLPLLPNLQRVQFGDVIGKHFFSWSMNYLDLDIPPLPRSITTLTLFTSIVTSSIVNIPDTIQTLHLFNQRSGRIVSSILERLPLLTTLESVVQKLLISKLRQLANRILY